MSRHRLAPSTYAHLTYERSRSTKPQTPAVRRAGPGRPAVDQAIVDGWGWPRAYLRARVPGYLIH